MKSELKLLLKIMTFELPIFIIYLFFFLLLFFICILYKIQLAIILDLIRYTVIPFLVIVGFQIYHKYSDTKTIEKMILNNDFKTVNLHGYYGYIYSQLSKKIMEQQLIEKQKLLSTLESRKDYLVLWSHEIKTPLTSLSLLAENNSYVASEEITEKIDLINYQLKQLLTFDRLDDFNHDLNFEKIDLNDCINTVIQDNATLFLSHEIRPVIDIPDVKVLTDSKWFSFILEQIITNAVKYSDKNSEINITYKNGALSFVDHGIGIAQNDLPRVFEKGFTGENGRIYGESTGMGLYMVQRIAKILDIKVAISSIEKKETKVTLTFNPQKITNCKFS